MGAGDVHVGLGRHPRVADRVRALGTPPRLVHVGHLCASPRSFTISSEWPSERTSQPGHVLEVVGQRLQVAVVAHLRPVGVLGLALDPVDGGADLVQPRLHLLAMPFEPLVEVEVAWVVRVGQLEADHDEVALAGPNSA